jgi:hypothetical protein
VINKHRKNSDIVRLSVLTAVYLEDGSNGFL